MDRLARQLQFILEIDRLKQVLRRSYITGGSRRENSAEHSWHVAVMAAVLAEHALEPVDVGRVIGMMLVHDIVEVDAGDTFCYDVVGYEDKADREMMAADRIFGLLPADQAVHFRGLWDEFEARETAEAKYAAALDRLMPLMHNVQTQGRTWQEHGVTYEQVIERNRHMAEGAPELWKFAKDMIDKAVEDGYLAKCKA